MYKAFQVLPVLDSAVLPILDSAVLTSLLGREGLRQEEEQEGRPESGQLCVPPPLPVHRGNHGEQTGVAN